MFTPPPWLSYLLILLSVRLHRARTAPTKGASAVEWVVITAIIAGVALGLATLIRSLVEDKQGEIENAFNDGGLGGGNGGS
jgi:Flp pilus assembly pilin Flp